MSTAINISNLSKQYRLGQVGTGTITHDLNRWWANIRGKEDPYSKVGQSNKRQKAAAGEYVWALKDVNLEVKRGEVLGLIGSNGAGKSTLLKLISRITSPTSGEIRAKGRIASLLEVGTGMHAEMTARENIYLNGSVLGMRRSEISRKFDDIIDFAGCRMYVDTPVKRFSSGMHVRLGFAVAAFLEPEILIVDEVLAVGDAEFQRRAIGKMQDVSASRGRTILFVSHNMASIENLSDRVAVLRNGELYFQGAVHTAVNHYLNESNSVSSVDLSVRKDRSGSGELRIRRIDLVDDKGDAVPNMKCGEPAIVQISYERDERLTCAVTFSVQIKDKRGDVLATLNSRISGQQFSPNRTGRVACQISDVPLFPGTYFLNCACQLSDAQASIVDYVESAFEFNVAEGDYFGTGQMPSCTKGVLLRNAWSEH